MRSTYLPMASPRFLTSATPSVSLHFNERFASTAPHDHERRVPDLNVLQLSRRLRCGMDDAPVHFPHDVALFDARLCRRAVVLHTADERTIPAVSE